MPYKPLPAEPFPPNDGWFLLIWIEEEENWCPGQPRSTKEEALAALHSRREKYPDEITRLVRETRTYTTEDD
jgi:crotonobetainyl-CoA:carnitine CoA-transferase CaiB-like acyl-CoA transferase